MPVHVSDDSALGGETLEGPAIQSLAGGESDSPGQASPPEDALSSGAYLEIAGVAEDEPIVLSKPAMRLGRGISADIRIDDTTVSRRHALIVRRGQRTLVLDDRSMNGVHVNGRRVSESPLHDGDIIVLGRVVIRYREVR